LAESRCETVYIRTKAMPQAQTKIITVGVTGASGAVFAQKTLSLLEDDPRVGQIHLVATETGHLRRFEKITRADPGAHLQENRNRFE
jgi:3-polyprenyl-4-hydroxybenzoate decarboxylase